MQNKEWEWMEMRFVDWDGVLGCDDNKDREKLMCCIYPAQFLTSITDGVGELV